MILVKKQRYNSDIYPLNHYTLKSIPVFYLDFFKKINNTGIIWEIRGGFAFSLYTNSIDRIISDLDIKIDIKCESNFLNMLECFSNEIEVFQELKNDCIKMTIFFIQKNSHLFNKIEVLFVENINQNFIKHLDNYLPIVSIKEIYEDKINKINSFQINAAYSRKSSKHLDDLICILSLNEINLTNLKNVLNFEMIKQFATKDQIEIIQKKIVEK